MSRKPEQTLGNNVPWTSGPYKERIYSDEQITTLGGILSKLPFLYVVTEAFNFRKHKTLYFALAKWRPHTQPNEFNTDSKAH